MDLELWQLAVAIGDDPVSRGEFLAKRPEELSAAYLAGTLPPQAQAGVRGFLARYGHRAVAEIDLGMPRWSEQPDHILGMISNYLRVEDPEQAPDRQFARAAEHAEDRIRSLVDRARVRGRLARTGGGAQPAPRAATGGAARTAQVLHRGGPRRRCTGSCCGSARTWPRRGRSPTPMTSSSSTSTRSASGLRGADLHGMVADRRRLYDIELRRRRIPRLLLSDGTDVEAAMMAKSPAQPAAVTGTPASAGTATGRVRVIMDPVGAHLEPGEILVAPSTDPGWTPLFLTAGALVMEMGGVISHGAVVAREYGIPAVVGVPDATTRLRTGQTVTVDGAAGTIREEPSPAQAAATAVARLCQIELGDDHPGPPANAPRDVLSSCPRQRPQPSGGSFALARKARNVLQRVPVWTWRVLMHSVKASENARFNVDPITGVEYFHDIDFVGDGIRAHRLDVITPARQPAAPRQPAPARRARCPSTCTSTAAAGRPGTRPR